MEKGYSMRRAAELLGVSPAAAHKWVHGTAHMTPEHARAAAVLLGIDPAASMLAVMEDAARTDPERSVWRQLRGRFATLTRQSIH
jgi:predicted transcriptional regulator